VRNREEDIPVYKKRRNAKIEERKFYKHASVFGQFKADSEETLEACFENDRKFWKLYRFIKDPGELMGAENALRDNYAIIKAVFDLIKASGKEVNSISSFDFKKFAYQVNLLQIKGPKKAE